MKYRSVQYLERLDEGPEESSNTFASTQELHESHYAEKSEKADTHEWRLFRLQNNAEVYIHLRSVIYLVFSLVNHFN